MISVWKCPKCQVLMQLNEKCVKCYTSMVYLADYEGISIDKMLVEASLADLA
jgi:ABC-type ATPase with predicted acetyltransferase domain